MSCESLPVSPVDSAPRSPRPLPHCVPTRYEIVREIGGGGMGTVYLARDRRTGRSVAVKVLDATDCPIVQRFRREAVLAGRMRDPSIVEVYDTGQCDGRPFLAMRFVDGPNLASVELDTDRLIACAVQVAGALQHAHARGIVHRDIKPENILLDRTGRAYLTDFGLARDLLDGGDSSVSVDGQIMGTPWSMSPEQARGDPQAVDPRSDVFSLGATLYAKLTGRRPFVGETLVDVLHAVLHDDARPPRAVRAGIPRELERIVMRCLRKDPDARYQTMGELQTDLERFAARRRYGSPLVRWLRRLRRWPARAALAPQPSNR